MTTLRSHKLQQVYLEPATPLRTAVWRIRRSLRDTFGVDLLATDMAAGRRHKRKAVRAVYRRLDDLLAVHVPRLQKQTPHAVALQRVRDVLESDLHYTFSDVDERKPWGAYYRIEDRHIKRFLGEFFPDLTETEAKLGRKDVSLSPKIMVVYPGSRLSWQYHKRRAECWRFLMAGAYYRSDTDKMGRQTPAGRGSVVQFATGERHRLCALPDEYTVVAEIWQHTDVHEHSTEADIIRLADDYNR